MTRSTRGPKILTFAGIGTMLLAVVVGVLVGFLFVGLLPTGVLAADGSDGPDVVGSVEAPGTVELTLEADTDYALYLARPQEYTNARIPELSEVTDPQGVEVSVRRAAGVSSNSSRGGVTAGTIGGFSTGVEGTYLLQVHEPMFAPEGTRVLVVPDQTFTSFFGGLLGTIGGVFLAIALLLVGVGLTVGGGVWWGVRRRSATPPPTPEASPGA